MQRLPRRQAARALFHSYAGRFVLIIAQRAPDTQNAPLQSSEALVVGHPGLEPGTNRL